MKKLDLEFNNVARMECIDAAIKHYALYANSPKIKNTDMIIAVNMREPSYRKRLHVVELIDNSLSEASELIIHTIRDHHVAHGVNSSNPRDRAYANNFSNTPGSRCTSLGAMATAETYKGKHGLSCKLDGLEQGLNDNVRDRYIVIHSADYVTDRFILANGRAGQSDGCAVVDPSISESLIELIKGGCFFYVYY